MLVFSMSGLRFSKMAATSTGWGDNELVHRHCPEDFTVKVNSNGIYSAGLAVL